MVCLLAESARYISPSRYLKIFIRSIHWTSHLKRKLNWPGICQWNPPSQAFYPSIRTCINCWNLSNVRPASVAGSICDTFQDFNRFKFQRCENSPPRFTAGVGNELQTHTKNDPTDTCRWTGTQKIPHPWLMTDWKMINITPKDIKRSCFVQNSSPLGQLDSCPQSVWHLQVETPGAGQTPAARPWWYTSLHLERPQENDGIMHHWKPDPSSLVAPQACHFQCGITWDLQFFKPFLGWPKWRTRTQLDVHITRKSRKVACLLASRRFAELNLRKATAKLKSAIVYFQPPEINLYHSGVHTNPNHLGF